MAFVIGSFHLQLWVPNPKKTLSSYAFNCYSYYKLAVSTMCSDPSKSVPMAMDILLGILDIEGLSWGLYILIQFDGTMIIRLYIMFPEILFWQD